MRKVLLSMLLLTTFSFASVREHMVIMRIEGGLRKGDGYKVEDVNPLNGLKTWKINSGTDDNLESISAFEMSEGTGENAFESGSDYKYEGSSDYNYITFEVEGNTSKDESRKGVLNLTEKSKIEDTGEEYINIYIEEEFNLPINYIDLEEDKNYKDGNRFTYTENSGVISKHKELYKRQDYLVRISLKEANVKYDVHNKNNGIKLANEGDNIKDFLSGTKNYIDFKFNGDFYNEIQSVRTDYGVGMNFVPGKLEVFGLPNKEYNIEFYSFRYKNEFSDRDNLIITLEDRISFTGSGIEDAEGINLLNFSSENYPQIKAVLLTISENKLESLLVREGVKGESLSDVNPTKLEGITLANEELFINGETITLDDESKHNGMYYRKWEIEYNSPEMRGTRQAEFSYKKNNTKYYTLADYLVNFSIPINKEYPHQTVLARFNPQKKWGINEKFEIKDIVLPKETLGYKQIKMSNSDNMDKFMKGAFIDCFTLTQDLQNFLWDGGNRKETNSIIFKKAISASKGTLFKEDEKYLIFILLEE